MIIGKSKKEIEKMRAAGRLVAEVREALRRMVRPGVNTLELDMAAEKIIRDAGALPTFKGYHGFPFSICASVTEQVVHGFLRGQSAHEDRQRGVDRKLKRPPDLGAIDVGRLLVGDARRDHRQAIVGDAEFTLAIEGLGCECFVDFKEIDVADL